MVVSAGVILIAGGLCALAPLFKRASKSLARFLTIIGLLVGVVVLVVAVDYALALNFLSSITQIPSPAALSSLSAPYLNYFLPAMIVLGVLLVSRPIRNVRWASIISLALGLLISYFLRTLLPSLFTSSTVLVIVFLISTLAIYTLLRFVEDIFNLVGSILAFPPIAIGIGLVNIYFGILFLTV
jgi:hypothetical protein